MKHSLTLILIGFILIGINVHAQPFIVQPFEQPHAYVTHTGLATHELSIINLKTKNITMINSTFGASLKTTLINDRGTRAYLFFQNTNGLFIESWDLIKKKKIIGPTTNLFGTETNYQALLAHDGKTIAVMAYNSSLNTWTMHVIDTTTLNVISNITIPGKGIVGKFAVSLDQTKIYAMIGPTIQTASEITLSSSGVKSINALFSAPDDLIVTPEGPVTSHTVGPSSQLQKINFTPTPATIQTIVVAVVSPPQITVSPNGTKIGFLPSTHEFKGGFLTNFTFQCSLNTINTTWKGFPIIGESLTQYALTETTNGPTQTHTLVKQNTNNCGFTNHMTITNAPYAHAKSQVSLTSKEDYLVAIEGNNIHIFDLIAKTETILNVGPTASVVTRDRVKAISMP